MHICIFPQLTNNFGKNKCLPHVVYQSPCKNGSKNLVSSSLTIFLNLKFILPSTSSTYEKSLSYSNIKSKNKSKDTFKERSIHFFGIFLDILVP